MKKFLKQVAEIILEASKDKSLHRVIILPNKRSEVFLKDHIKKMAVSSLWLPDFYTVDEFMSAVSGIETIDPILLYFDLFEVHKEIAGSNHRSLEDFLAWAPIIMSDFNDIDLYMVDAHSVFAHLSAAKAIEKWNLDKKPLTELQTNYLDFYNSLFTYYQKINERLKVKKVGYKGMIYRHLAENISTAIQSKNWNHFIVIGLNALSESEKKLFAYLNQNFKTDFLWDADEYYINPGIEGSQEAGRFINEMIKEWKLENVRWIGNELRNEKGKTIKIIGVPKNIGQVKYTGQLLEYTIKTDINSGKTPEDKARETAVVLSDENLLIPLLNSLPKIENSSGGLLGYNITMGYPTQFSPFSQFVNQWLEMLIRMKENSQHKYLVDHLFALLKNPAINSFLNLTEQRNIEKFISNIRLSGSLYLSKSELIQTAETPLSGNFKELLAILLHSSNSTAGFIKSLNNFFQLLQPDSVQAGQINDILREQLISIYSTVRKLSFVLDQTEEVITLEALQKIFAQLVRRAEINLKGEPLNGIQIMGLLETRNLDFNNIIFLSANEGVLPKTDSSESFIPFDIKYAYHLPLPKDKIDIFAYHFYRLLQRVENLTLLYNSEPDALGGGEPSRFILQLKNELKRYNPSIRIEEQFLSFPKVSIASDHSIVIEKDSIVRQSIKEKAEKGFSPSALNNFISCPLKFYFSNILQLKPPETVDENIESDVFGSIVHGVFEEIYKPFVGKIIDPAELDNQLDLVDDYLNNQFKEKFKGRNIQGGKNLLVYRVAKHYINQFVKDDIVRVKESPTFLIATEEWAETMIETGGIKVKLRGIIDRVQKNLTSNILQIIDYKTGKVEPKELKIDDLTVLDEDQKMSKAFQLLFYTFVYSKKSIEIHEFEAGIFSMRNRSQGLIKLQLPEKQTMNDSLSQIEEQLVSVLSRIIDDQLPFTQTEDTDTCKWCDFINICNR